MGSPGRWPVAVATAAGLLLLSSLRLCVTAERSEQCQKVFDDHLTDLKLEISPDLTDPNNAICPLTGGTVTFKCTLEFKANTPASVRNMFYHIWLYHSRLPRRMAAFHPQVDESPGSGWVHNVSNTRRVFIDHPEGPRCGWASPVSDETLCAGTEHLKSRWNAHAEPELKSGNAGTNKFSLVVTNSGPTCCDSGNYHCWFFIYDGVTTRPCNKGLSVAPQPLHLRCDNVILEAVDRGMCSSNATEQASAERYAMANAGRSMPDTSCNEN